MTSVKYTGPKNTLRIDSRALDTGEVISEPAELVEALSKHPNFEIVGEPTKSLAPAPKHPKKQKKPADEPKAAKTSEE